MGLKSTIRGFTVSHYLPLEFSAGNCLTKNMKRLCIFFSILFFLFFSQIFNQTVFAADKTGDELYQEFLQNYRRYQSLIEPFNTQRSRQKTYQSVATQADFLNAAKSLASAEVEAMISYASFVKTYLAQATQILDYNENYLYVMLDGELLYLSSAKNKVSSLSSLSDTQAFFNDLSTHFAKISQIGYQVKSLVEIGSAKKTLQNVKVETNKIEALLGEITEEESKIYAAKEKFTSLKDELSGAENSIAQAEKTYEGTEEGSDFASMSKRVRGFIDQSINQFSSVISGYKNIVSSLK